MKMSLAASSSFAEEQLMVVLVIGLTVDISAAVIVDICSEGTTPIYSRSVAISSPNYPSKHQILNDIICSCYVTTGPNSNDDIRIEPLDIDFDYSRTACYASIELWNPVERIDKKYCLNSPSKNVSRNVAFKSVYLTNVTYQAFRPSSLMSYRGKFLISVTASRAATLLLMCTSFPSTSTATETQVISSTNRSTSAISSSTISKTTSTTMTPDTMPNSSNPHVDAWSSTENITIIALPLSDNGNLLWILIGVLVPIALIALVATTMIACRVRKLKKHSADTIAVGNFWGRDGVGSLSTLINNSHERTLRTNECTAEPSTAVACQEENLSSTGQQNRQTTRQSSNYTPMNQNGPRTFSKTSLSTSIYADIQDIQSQHGSVFRGSAASPPVREETCENVYYNTATDATSVQLARRSEINAYETCYSPEIEGVTSLNHIGLNSPAYDAYTSIDERATGVSDLSTGGRKVSVYDDDEAVYCNVVDQRENGAMPRKTSGAEVTLVENQLYSS